MAQNKPKLDRRAAIGVLMMATPGLATVDAQTAKVNINLDRFASFTVSYKGKSQTFSTQDVYDTLFGEGRFGD